MATGASVLLLPLLSVINTEISLSHPETGFSRSFKKTVRILAQEQTRTLSGCQSAHGSIGRRKHRKRGRTRARRHAGCENMPAVKFMRKPYSPYRSGLAACVRIHDPAGHARNVRKKNGAGCSTFRSPPRRLRLRHVFPPDRYLLCFIKVNMDIESSPR